MSNNKHNFFFFCFFLIIATPLSATRPPIPYKAPQAAGGLTVIQPRAITIEREDVLLSPERITVSYVFKNNFSLDLVETLAFELPFSYYRASSNERLQHDLKFLVNGTPVKIKEEKRAISQTGKDITELLQSLEVPTHPNQFDPALAMSTRKTLRLHQLLSKDTEHPLWFEKTLYYWQQQFPATKTIHIQQSFKPTTRLIASTPNATPLTHCRSNAKHAQLLDQSKRIETLSFGLTQNSNWARPIKQFTLRVKSPRHLTPLICGPYALEEQDPHHFIFYTENFVPLEDIHLYFLS